MPTTSSVVSTYTTFLTSAFVINSMIREAQNVTNQIVPKRIQQIILSKLEALFFTKKNQTPPDQIMTLIIDEHSNGSFVNQLFEASEIYLRTKITPSASLRRLKVSKLPKDKSLVLTVTPGQKIMDEFEGISLTWDITNEKKDNSSSSSNTQVQKRVIELSFDSKYMEKVLNSYLSHVMETSKSMKEEDVVLKLYGQGNIGIGQQRGGWGSITLDHPSTFETLAMEPSLKSSIIQDLDRFVRRRSFYKRVGKAWKRGYLLYGPPGTGKSSLIAAMANYLHFSIYDLQLSSVHSDSELKRLFLSTSNRSILVIEDIDCGNLPSRKNQDTNESQIKATRQVTLSGLLNFIDGLWSSCGDERIIIFTTNHKERLEPALLRPGRMDMQINMSYCTPAGFRTLVSNYLGVTTHHLLPEIDELIKEIEVTPAEIAEEFMRSEDPDIALQGLTECLQRKKRGVVEDDDSDSKVGNKKKKKATDGGDENVDIKKIREY